MNIYLVITIISFILAVVLFISGVNELHNLPGLLSEKIKEIYYEEIEKEDQELDEKIDESSSNLKSKDVLGVVQVRKFPLSNKNNIGLSALNMFLYENSDTIDVKQIDYITEELHGTSSTVAYVTYITNEKKGNLS